MINTETVIGFYNGQLSTMKNYDDNTNGRLQRIKLSLSKIVRPGMSVLDVGCGTGVTSRYMAQLGAEVTGVDIAPDLIEYAKSKSNGHKINYITGDATNLDIDRAFDVIVMADVVEHIPRSYVFGTIHRFLRYHALEDTQVYLNMPNFSFLKFMQKRYPEKLQIIDEAWKLDDIISLFAYMQFVPRAIQMFGLDVEAQYVEYLFVREDHLDKKYQNKMKEIYRV